MATLDAETIVARCIPILRYASKPLDAMTLSRILTGTDSSSVFRALSNCPEVEAVRGTELTVFSYKAKEPA